MALSHNRLGNKTYQQTDGRKVSVDFCQPGTKSPLKYDQHYLPKPLSTPINSYNNYVPRPDNNRTTSPQNRDGSVSSYSKSSNNRPTSQYRDRYYQPSNDRSTFSKSSKDNNSISSGYVKGMKVAYQGYDMKKTKNKNEVVKLNDLGHKIEYLKSELKTEIDSIL